MDNDENLMSLDKNENLMSSDNTENLMSSCSETRNQIEPSSLINVGTRC